MLREQQKYHDTIPQPKFLPSIRDLFADNTPFFTSRIQLPVTTHKYANSGSQRRAHRAGQEIALTSVEHLWPRLNKNWCIGGVNPIKKELIEAVIVSWYRITKNEKLQTLAGSILLRCAVVSENK